MNRRDVRNGLRTLRGLCVMTAAVSGASVFAGTDALTNIRYTAETRVGAVELVHVGLGKQRDAWVRVGESFADGIRIDTLDQKTGRLTVSRGSEQATLFLPGGAVAARTFDDELAALPYMGEKDWRFGGSLQSLLEQASKAAGIEVVIRPNSFPEGYGFGGIQEPRELLKLLLKMNGIAAVLEDGKWTLEPLNGIETRDYEMRPDQLTHLKRAIEQHPNYWQGVSIDPQPNGKQRIVATQRQHILIDDIAHAVNVSGKSE